MVFTHDTDMTLMHAAALANTGPALGDEDREELPDLPALLAWMDRWEWTGARPTTRPRWMPCAPCVRGCAQIWSRDEEGLVEAANTLLEEGHALPRLVRHGAFGWHVHATCDDAPLRPADLGRGRDGAGRRHPRPVRPSGSRSAPATTARTCSST